MVIEIHTKVSVGDSYGQKLGNLTLEDAKFFGRPNFRGEEDQFKDARAKFTVLIPNDVADQLRDLGWNVKTTCPTAEQEKEGMECISHLKVMVDVEKCDVWIIMGEDREKLEAKNLGVIDKSRIEEMDMEIRAWMYNVDEVRTGTEEPRYSARLVTLVANIKPNLLSAKYGNLV